MLTSRICTNKTALFDYKHFHLTTVSKNVPTFGGLPRLCKHFIPVFHFWRSAFAPEYHLTNELVASHLVMIHHGYDEACIADTLIREPEHEHLIKDRIESLLQDWRLALFHLLFVLQQPHFDVRIWIFKSTVFDYLVRICNERALCMRYTPFSADLPSAHCYPVLPNIHITILRELKKLGYEI